MFLQEKHQSRASSGQNSTSRVWIFFARCVRALLRDTCTAMCGRRTDQVMLVPPTNRFRRCSFGTVPRSAEREVCFGVHLGEVTTTPARKNSSLQLKVTGAGVKTLLQGPKRGVLTHFGGMWCRCFIKNFPGESLEGPTESVLSFILPKFLFYFFVPNPFFSPHFLVTGIVFSIPFMLILPIRLCVINANE